MIYTLRFPPGLIDKEVQAAVEGSGVHFVYHEAGAILTAPLDPLRVLWGALKEIAKKTELPPEDRRRAIMVMHLIKTQAEAQS